MKLGFSLWHRIHRHYQVKSVHQKKRTLPIGCVRGYIIGVVLIRKHFVPIIRELDFFSTSFVEYLSPFRKCHFCKSAQMHSNGLPKTNGFRGGIVLGFGLPSRHFRQPFTQFVTSLFIDFQNIFFFSTRHIFLAEKCPARHSSCASSKTSFLFIFGTTLTVRSILPNHL